MNAVYETQLTSLPLVQKGKVRDIYDIDDQRMLIVTTDRMSAFDVILPTPVAGKGEVLTDVANFWFSKTGHIIPNHLDTEFDLKTILTEDEFAQVGARSMVVRKLKPLPVEAIVRGYLVGSGWAEYQTTQSVCGIDLPSGLNQASQLPEPIFTPSTKADVGDHDINIDFARTVELLGEELAKQVRDVSLALYQYAAEFAREKGIIIADTKFEFGLDSEDNLILIDEALTPDSSRFWDVQTYAVGSNPPSFDKQIIRDYLSGLDWDKTPPGPELPTEIVEQTMTQYKRVAEILKSA